MYRGFKQKPEIGQRVSVLLLSFVCLIGVGIGDFSYTKLLENGLGGGVRQSQERSFIRTAFEFICGIDPLNLPGVLEKGLPYSVTRGRTATVSSRGTEKQPVEKTLYIDDSFLEKELAKKPIEVAVYHTHNAETYIPFQGKSRDEGKNGGITLVGEEIVKTLSQHGVRAVQDLTIHDYPDHPTSYIKSKVTAKRLLEEYPDLKILIDLHRDAGIPKKQTVVIDGKEAAKLLFVIGNGQRISNPHWRENYALARQIANRLDEKYPGLVKAVRLKDGCYNQNLSPNAILVEVGSDKNTLDEALITGRCFAEVVAELIQEEDE
ncbi:MAG: stage II sporulation protein P [Syntrophaceticus sp.]